MTTSSVSNGIRPGRRDDGVGGPSSPWPCSFPRFGAATTHAHSVGDPGTNPGWQLAGNSRYDGYVAPGAPGSLAEDILYRAFS